MAARARSGHATNHVKHVKLKHHHAKPYRKRHVGSLVIFASAAIVLLLTAYNYDTQVRQGVVRATNFVATLFGGTTSTTAVIDSTYGFGLTYDPQQFYASAVDSVTGDIFFDAELAIKRAYDTLRISHVGQDKTGTYSALKLRYLDNVKASTPSDSQLKSHDRAAVLAGLDAASVVVTERSRAFEDIDGVSFSRVDWQIKPKTSTKVSLTAYATTYVGVVHGRAMIITINSGITPEANELHAIVTTLQFGKRTQAATVSAEKVARAAEHRSLLDNLLLADFAHASGSQVSVGSSERTSSLYSPAVVKIFNLYCMDVKVGPSYTVTNLCGGGTGSGFFISGEGVIASNGHVTSADPKDLVIYDSILRAVRGDQRAMEYLLTLAEAKESDFSGLKTQDEILAKIVDMSYDIPDSKFVVSNNVQNLLVDLGSKQPDIKELMTLTLKRQKYSEQDTIKAAEFLGADYRKLDGINGFKASDVALIKVSGTNYPVVKLGSIDGLVQGADIMILGYPGNAGDNGIVSADESKVTLTAGKVSSVKSASGSNRKLIETDTTIGHGNSGGPAFNQSGQVVGIATYTSDGAGKGDGTFNYVRDIKDLKDLASKLSTSSGSGSTTQTEWEKGINAFYASHYKSAKKTFEKVKQLYAAHPKADEFIAAAQERINNGEDVPEINIPLLAGAILAALAGVGGAIFFILRQRKMHGVYNAHVASGTLAPMAKGAAPVVVPLVPSVPAPAGAGSAPAVTPVATPVSAAPAAAATTQAPVAVPVAPSPEQAPAPTIVMPSDAPPPGADPTQKPGGPGTV